MSEVPATITPDGRARLLDTAEELFDRDGIDGVSARMIGIASGHRNTAAVHYHFGDRESLIRAVLSRRADEVNATRRRLLAELEAQHDRDPQHALRAMILPLTALLDDVRGRRYLRLLNQAANHPQLFVEADLRYGDIAAQGAFALAPLLAHLSPIHRAHRAKMTLGLVLFAIAEQARLIDSDAPLRPILPTDAFVDDLVRTALAVLGA